MMVGSASRKRGRAVSSGHDSPVTKQDRSGGIQDKLALVSLGLAFAIAIE
jgi:hypothetical protein